MISIFNRGLPSNNIPLHIQYRDVVNSMLPCPAISITIIIHFLTSNIINLMVHYYYFYSYLDFIHNLLYSIKIKERPCIFPCIVIFFGALHFFGHIWVSVSCHTFPAYGPSSSIFHFPGLLVLLPSDKPESLHIIYLL